MPSVSVHLTENNLKKLASHEPTLLRHSQLGSGPHTLHLKPRKHRRIQTAIRKRKGMVLSLDGQELQASLPTMQGGSFKSFVKSVGRKIKSFYNEQKPEIRKAVQGAVKQGLQGLVAAGSTMYGVPELAPAGNALIDKYSDNLVGKFGDVTGAYGLGRSLGPRRTSSRVNHRRRATSGGSFLPSGY